LTTRTGDVQKKTTRGEDAARALLQDIAPTDLTGMCALLVGGTGDGRATLVASRALLERLDEPRLLDALTMASLPARERVRAFAARYAGLLTSLDLEAFVQHARALRVEPFRGPILDAPTARYGVLEGALLPVRPRSGVRADTPAPVVSTRGVAAQLELDALLKVFRRWGFVTYRKGKAGAAASSSVPSFDELFAPLEAAVPRGGKAWGRALLHCGALTLETTKGRLVIAPALLDAREPSAALRTIMAGLWRRQAQCLAMDVDVLGPDAWRVAGCVQQQANPTAHRDLLLAGLRRLPVGAWVEVSELASAVFADGLLTAVAESLRAAWFDTHGVRVKSFRPDAEDGEPFRLRVPSLLAWLSQVLGQLGLVDLAAEASGAGAVRRASLRSPPTCAAELAALTHVRMTALGAELLDPFVATPPAADQGPGEDGLDALADLLTRM
jgi:hypothetical protein